MSEELPDGDTILRFDAYDPADERRREVLFALGNGVLVTRGAAADAVAGERHYPGTYRAGGYNRLSTEIAGERVETESLVNLPNWLPLTFRIDGGAWFCIDAVDIEEYRHQLDLRHGISLREVAFRDAEGRRTRLREERFISMASSALAAMRLELVPLDWSDEVEFRSALDGDVGNTNVRRYAPYAGRHLEMLDLGAQPGEGLLLRSRTCQSRMEVVQIQRTVLVGAQPVLRSVEQGARVIAEHIRCAARRDHAVAIEKTVGFVTSRDVAVLDPVRTARTALARAPGFAELSTAHGKAWRHLWSRVALRIGAEDVDRAVRLHAFHLLQTASPHTADLDAGVPARGWHGEGYRGHIFWDDIFAFSFLNYRFPALARALLRYRYRRLGEARAAAKDAGYRGAMYPWRSASDGREVTPRHQLNLLSGRWMADPTHLQRHIGSAIAYNIWHYYLATDDTGFLAEQGAEMLLEIARFWASRVEYDARDDRFDIRGVIGPDEYHNAYPGASSPGLDNNAYTNVMAVWTLCRALDVLDQLPSRRGRELRDRLALGDDELRQWQHVTRRMRIVFHGDGIISQFEGFDRLRPFDQERLPPEFRDARVDWALEAIGESADLYRVTKQADTLTLFHLLEPEAVVGILHRLGYPFDAAQLRRTVDYYLDQTTHRSSLSRVVYAGAIAELDPELSWQLYHEALGTDLHALKGESIEEGIHLGAMAGTLDVLQRRYLGLEASPQGLSLRPSLPAALGEVCMNLEFRGAELRIETCGHSLRISSESENRHEITILHADGSERLRPGAMVSIPLRRTGSTPR